jgi:diguanylate cyclase (GGDEF)-like protein
MEKLTPKINITFLNNKSTLLKDLAVALSWAIILGIPLFIVHMVLFDFEHGQHMGDTYSFILSITETVPNHPISLALWLSAIFIASFAIRRTFAQRIMLMRTQEKLSLSHTQSLTDGLTGVWNRAGFELLHETIISRAQNENCPFSIILGDVDGLKKYNDSFGHPQADIALQTLTRLLSAQIRSTDAIARYGGDEFAIFCFDLDRDGAECLISRMTNALKNAPLTMSFGVASFPADGLDSKTLIQKADIRLYEAKSNAQAGPLHRNSDCQCNDCQSGNKETSGKPSASELS